MSQITTTNEATDQIDIEAKVVDGVKTIVVDQDVGFVRGLDTQQTSAILDLMLTTHMDNKVVKNKCESC